MLLHSYLTFHARNDDNTLRSALELHDHVHEAGRYHPSAVVH